MKYIYLIASGEYSSYSVNGLAISDIQLTQETLQLWQDEMSKLVGQDLGKWLQGKGLKIVYPAGEFWEAYCGGRLDFFDTVRVGEENAFRLNLA